MPAIRAFGTIVTPDTTATRSMAVAESSPTDYGFRESPSPSAGRAAVHESVFDAVDGSSTGT
jgi:hypothetical protein